MPWAGYEERLCCPWCERLARVGFIVTNLEMPSRAVVPFYNKRGTAEQWIKEGMQAVKMTGFPVVVSANEVRNRGTMAAVLAVRKEIPDEETFSSSRVHNRWTVPVLVSLHRAGK